MTDFKFTIFVKELLQFFVIHIIAKVLDVDVGELFGLGAQLSLPFFARFEATHKPENRATVGTNSLVEQFNKVYNSTQNQTLRVQFPGEEKLHTQT